MLARFRRKVFIKISGAVAGIITAATLLSSAQVYGLTIGGPSDCNANAVINCGAHSTAEVQTAYHSSSYIRQVYGAFGIGQEEIDNLGNTAVAGRVTASNQVFIDSKSYTVATNATTAGRQNIAGSTLSTSGGATFYKRSPSVSFRQASLPAYVVMQNGHFLFAIIASCGNPVVASAIVANPVKPAPQPQPQPTPPAAPAAPQQPQQQQSQSQQQIVNQTNQTIVETPPAPTPPQPAPIPVTVAPSSQPASTTLPNTGPASLGTGIGLFIGAATLGFFLYRRHLSATLSQ